MTNSTFSLTYKDNPYKINYRVPKNQVVFVDNDAETLTIIIERHGVRRSLLFDVTRKDSLNPKGCEKEII